MDSFAKNRKTCLLNCYHNTVFTYNTLSLMSCWSIKTANHIRSDISLEKKHVKILITNSTFGDVPRRSRVNSHFASSTFGNVSQRSHVGLCLATSIVRLAITGGKKIQRVVLWEQCKRHIFVRHRQFK